MMRSADICQAMLKFANKFSQNQQRDDLKIEDFVDGLPFAHMLIDSEAIVLSVSELEVGSHKWISKVSNLKKILTRIANFLELTNQKTERIGDIDVVQIAKNGSPEHLAKYFEVVMAVLMSSTAKEKYIQLIMTLEEGVQNTFVEIIQNSLDQQTSAPQSSSLVRLEEDMAEARIENAQLKAELAEMTRKCKGLQREVGELRQKVFWYEEQAEKGRSTDNSVNSGGLQSQVQQQRVLIDNLKMKLMATVRQSQVQISHLREQLTLLRLKCKGMQELEATLQQYKEMYNKNLGDQQLLLDLEKDKRRLTRQVEEKEQTIKKLQAKIDTTIQKNCSMQENELYMKLELEKREARFKQLEKEVKTRLKSQPSEITPRIADVDPKEEEKEEMAYLQDQLNKARITIKELEKQSIKNRKRVQGLPQLQASKKKLEKIVLEVNRSKDAEIQMLVVSLYELRNENIKLFELLKGSQGKISSEKML